MKKDETYVRARIDVETKERAASVLETMGLSISAAIRLLMVRVAEQKQLPFDLDVPNTTTREAMAEIESGTGRRANTLKDLMAELNAED